jgi:hypothetical protein
MLTEEEAREKDLRQILAELIRRLLEGAGS